MKEILYLWHISQNENKEWNIYESMIVAAFTEEEAKQIHPKQYCPIYLGRIKYENNKWYLLEELLRLNEETGFYHYCGSRLKEFENKRSGWASSAEYVIAKNIGIANEFIKPGEILCSSFIAG